MDPGARTNPVEERPASRSDGPNGTASARQELLDDFFDSALEALQTGAPIPFPAELRDDPSLTAAAERLADVARTLSGFAAPTTHIRGYTILSELGRGGMGVVYLARQDRLGGRPVAIKLLPPHIAGSLSARARFRAEVLSVAKQRHAGVVSVFDIVEDGETLACIMEWVDGISLQHAINLWTDAPAPDSPELRMSVLRETLDATELNEPLFRFAARIGESVARALASVHATNVVHRDVKPSNILIRRDGTPLLADFGLAKDAAHESLTVGAGFLGTLGYSSPEQLRGEDLDPRADVFSLGATLYHLLVLKPPTPVTGVPAAIRSLTQGHHLEALRASSSIPPGLATVIGRAMAFDRNHRFNSATELADALAEASAAPHSPSSRRSPRRSTLARWALVPAAILVGAAATWALRTEDPAVSPDTWQNPTRLTISDPTPGDEFARALSGHGNRLLASTPWSDFAPLGDDRTDVGRAAVFVHEKGNWRQEAELSPPQIGRGSRFGESAVLARDTAIVSAVGETVDGVPFAGAVYVFGRIDGQWNQTQRVTAPVPFEQDAFGYRIAASGDIVVITSYYRSPVAAKRGPSAMPAGTGPAHVFRLRDHQLIHLQTIAPDSLRSPDISGLAPEVAEGGDCIILAGPFANTPAGDQTGVVYIYARRPSADQWLPVQELKVPAPRAYDNFGTKVVAFRPKRSAPGLKGLHLAVSAATWSYPEATRVGRVFVFRPSPDATPSGEDLTGLRWVLDSEIGPEARDRVQHSLFGHAMIELDGQLAIFRKTPGSRGMKCEVVFYSPSATGWLQQHTIRLGQQEDDDLGVAMDSWIGGDGRPSSRHVVIAAPKLDWPEPADDHQNRGVVWAWRLPAR